MRRNRSTVPAPTSQQPPSHIWAFDHAVPCARSTVLLLAHLHFAPFSPVMADSPWLLVTWPDTWAPFLLPPALASPPSCQQTSPLPSLYPLTP